jgi:hypothetical protein
MMSHPCLPHSHLEMQLADWLQNDTAGAQVFDSPDNVVFMQILGEGAGAFVSSADPPQTSSTLTCM